MRSAHTERLLHTEASTHIKLLHREAFTHSKLFQTPRCDTESFLHAAFFCTRQAFTHANLLHAASVYTQRSLYTRQAFTQHCSAQTSSHSKLCTEKLCTQHAFTLRSLCTQQTLRQRGAVTQRSFYTEKPLRTDAFAHGSFLHKEALSHRTLCELVCARHVPVLLCTTKLWQAVSQKYFVITTLLAQNASQNYFVLQDLHRALPSILPCNTNFTKRTSLYYFVLHRPQQVLPSTTFYYKACAKNFPELLSSTKLAQNTSQNCFVRESSDKALLLCFVLQNLHKVLPSTAFYYRGRHRYSLYCTGCTSTTQKYFVLHDLRKPLPSTTLHNKARNNTTLYYKACTKHFPLLLCTTKSCTNHFYTQQSFTLRTLLHREAFTQGTCYTQQAFTHRELSHTASFFTQ